jgi:multisubunit Na+/H+ antiporter MnhB subunit
MLEIILIACVLVAATMVVHAVGLTVLLMALRRLDARTLKNFWQISRLVVAMTWCLILFHLAEISVWGLFYLWWGCLPDSESAFYFAGVTYTTIGYGELVLAKPWRTLAPIEGLTGILMCGLSTGFFFAVVNYIYQSLHTRTSGGSTTDRT